MVWRFMACMGLPLRIDVSHGVRQLGYADALWMIEYFESTIIC